MDEDSEPTYELYNRVPIGGYALIKLATLPFGDSLSAKIYAARMLMLLFFTAAAALAYISLRRLASSPWIALTATLLAFSSAYCLYYADIISGEAMIDLFALLLVFHGMVIFEQEGRFRQLLAKTCIALLLGWHAYALLLPFIIFGLERDLFKALAPSSPNPIRVLGSFVRSRYLALGAAALLFGISVLAFNLTNEYIALNRETPLTELPSIQAITSRAPDTDAYSAEEIARYPALVRFPRASVLPRRRDGIAVLVRTHIRGAFHGSAAAIVCPIRNSGARRESDWLAIRPPP